MSDFVKIKVTYPNRETRPHSGASAAAVPATSGSGGLDRSRRVSPLSFAVIGGLVIAGGIGAGLFYTTVSGPSAPAAIRADIDTRAPEEQTASTAQSAAPGIGPRREADAGDAETTAEAVVASQGDDDVSRLNPSGDLSRFETGGRQPARDIESTSPRPGSSAPPPPVAAPALPERVAPGTNGPDGLADEATALPPPVKRPAVPEQTMAAAASPRPPGGSVARSQLTSSVRAREPVDRLSSRIAIGERGQRKLFYFTELKDLNGETVFHRWEHDGRTMATLRFEVGGDRWRAYSSKTIPAKYSGDWRVVVANARGDVLASARFVAE